MSKERRQQNGVLLIVACQSYRTRKLMLDRQWSKKRKAVMYLHQENKEIGLRKLPGSAKYM